jgi:hypothetical protein
MNVYCTHFRLDVDVSSGWCSPEQVTRTLYIVWRVENRFGNSGKRGKINFQLCGQNRRANWIVLYFCCFFLSGNRMLRETRNVSFLLEMCFIRIAFHLRLSSSFPDISVEDAGSQCLYSWFRHVYSGIQTQRQMGDGFVEPSEAESRGCNVEW